MTTATISLEFYNFPNANICLQTHNIRPTSFVQMITIYECFYDCVSIY